MSAEQLAALNSALANVPVAPGYDIAVEVAGKGYVCTSEAVGDECARATLRVAEVPVARCGQSRTRLIVDSEQTLAKLAQSGQAAAFRLLAARKLKIEGEMQQLQALKDELAPHQATLESCMAAASPSDAPGRTLTRCHSWVPDEAAPRCMAAGCGRTFAPPFVRRHHCRACGGVFCLRCAPRVNLWAPRDSRFCSGCRASATAPPPPAAPGPTPSLSLIGSTLSAPAAGKDEDDLSKIPGTGDSSEDDTQWLLEYQVEQELQLLYFRSRCVLLLATSLFAALLWRQRHLFVAVSEHFALLPVAGKVSFGLLACILAWVFPLAWRLVRVAWVIGVFTVSNLLAMRRASLSSAKGANAICEMTHRVHARFILNAVTDLSGFYVKLAQMASMQTAFPEAYHRELSKLQDAMPAEPHHLIERTLKEELGPNWRERVRLHPGPPLGSATIAQVHRATLRIVGVDGIAKEVEGVIKVQHRQIKGNLSVDMYSASLFANMMYIFAPGVFEDFGKTCRDIAEMTRSELDFRHEAEHQRTARDAALAHGIDVVIPVVYDQLVTKRLLAMEFIAGERIDTFARAAVRHEKMRLAHNLIDFFAFSFTQAGIFNCDPHPGNLLVTEDAKLCVLDWGQARRLSPAEMEAFSMLFVAASTKDPWLMVELGARIGLKFSIKGATSMVMALRFIMRDSRPVQISKGDMIMLEKMFTRFQKFEELAKVNGDARDMLQGPLLPLGKTADLLHNVSARLDVSMSLLQVFNLRGYALVLKRAAAPGQAPPVVKPASFSYVLGDPVALPPAPVPPPATPAGALDGQLRRMLVGACTNGQALGAQVVVLDAATGATISDFAVGHGSYLRARQLEPDTPFNIAEVSKLHIALGVLRLVELGRLRLNATLGELWPAAKSLHNLTVEQILSHTSGIAEVMLRDVKDVDQITSLPFMLKQLETCGIRPTLPPGYKQSYQHLMYGWLLAGALRGVDQELAATMDVGGRGGVAVNRSSFRGQEVADVAVEMDTPSSEDMATQFGQVFELLDMCERAEMHGATEDDKADAKAFMSLQGLLHLVTPSALRQPVWTQDACVPGAVAYSTARKVAQLLLSVDRGEVLRPETLREALRSRRVAGQRSPMHFTGFARYREAEWGLGLELLPLPGREGVKAWGHTSAGGSFAIAIPGRRPIIAAVLLNRVDGWERGLAQEVLDVVMKFAGGEDA